VHSFDLIVLDAFSDDAIPVHLLTREAFQTYFARLRSGCPLAVHVTNRYLDLNPVVELLARAVGKSVLRIHSATDAAQQTLAADWAIVGDINGSMDNLRAHAAAAPARPGPLWTDEYSNLFQLWK
jgi:spermidine synthase